MHVDDHVVPCVSVLARSLTGRASSALRRDLSKGAVERGEPVACRGTAQVSLRPTMVAGTTARPKMLMVVVPDGATTCASRCYDSSSWSSTRRRCGNAHRAPFRVRCRGIGDSRGRGRHPPPRPSSFQKVNDDATPPTLEAFDAGTPSALPRFARRSLHARRLSASCRVTASELASSLCGAPGPTRVSAASRDLGWYRPTEPAELRLVDDDPGLARSLGSTVDSVGIASAGAQFTRRSAG